MPVSVWQQTLGEFVEDLGSARPAPGGGAVSALSACMAAALLKMVLEITAKDGVNVDKYLAIVQAEMDVLRPSVDEDIDAFNSFLSARKLPDFTASEKARREKLLTETLMRCAEVPAASANAALRLVPVGKELVEFAPPKVLSDVGVALSLLDSSLAGLLFNVDINLQSTATVAAFSLMREERDRLAGEIAIARHELATASNLVSKKIAQT